MKQINQLCKSKYTSMAYGEDKNLNCDQGPNSVNVDEENLDQANQKDVE